MTIMDFAKNKHKAEPKKYQSTLQIENRETMPKELMVASIAIGRKWGGDENMWRNVLSFK